MKKNKQAELLDMLTKALDFHQKGDFSNAQALYIKALDLDENNFDVLNLYGALLLQKKEYATAFELISKAIKLDPKNSICHNNAGICLKNLRRRDESLRSYDRAISLNLKYEEAYFNRANILCDLRRFDDAIESYDEAIRLKPNYIEAILNKANTLGELRRFDEAIKFYNLALGMDPNYENARIGLAQTLRAMRNYKESLQNLHMVHSLKSSAVGMVALGDLYLDIEEFDLALVNYTNAIAIDPTYSGAWLGKGRVLSKTKRFPEAIECYLKSNELDATGDFEISKFLALNDQMMIASWENYEMSKDKIIESVNNGGKPVPFLCLSIIDDASVQFTATKNFVKRATTKAPLIDFKRSAHSKIRLGYFSADFKTHPVALLLSELFTLHNRELFEVVAFCLKKPELNDPMHQKLAGLFDYFIDVEEKSDQEISTIARELEIDIAVDLGGHTEDSRPDVFALRAAPIQINYFGYPGTSGSNYMDYMVADHVVIPPEGRKYFSEKIAYLPNSYMVDDSRRIASDVIYKRTDFGLPNNKFVFCCFNNAYKFNPLILRAWSNILLKTPNSIIWLSENNCNFRKNIIKEFQLLGIASDRVVFANKLESMADHLARYRLVDLFLDTHPYNAHTTALDALKMGVPVLTYCGEAFASRVAASLLTCLDLKELIATSIEEYELKAIELYSSQENLQRVQARLKENLKTKPLFNTQSYVSSLEILYLEMYRRYISGLSPDTFSFEDVEFA